jgi:hypothetical protein
LLGVVVALLLVRSVLLVRVMIALLLVCLRWVGRSAAVRVVALLVLALRRGTIAMLRRLRIRVVRWRRVGTLAALWVRTVMSLSILIMRLLSICLALGRIALVLLSIAMLLLLLVCAVVAVAIALTMALALTVVILTRHDVVESALYQISEE